MLERPTGHVKAIVIEIQSTSSGNLCRSASMFLKKLRYDDVIVMRFAIGAAGGTHK
jgi:hypothetical protein